MNQIEIFLNYSAIKQYIKKLVLKCLQGISPKTISIEFIFRLILKSYRSHLHQRIDKHGNY